MREAWKEFRLFIAEMMLAWALDVMSEGEERLALAVLLREYFRKAIGIA